MGKTRMSLLDLRVQVRELQSQIVGSRVANIYDVSSRTFIFKLSVPPYLKACRKSGEDPAPSKTEHSWRKVFLLVESGARIHLTQFDRGKGTLPSGLCLKLRKHIRTRRLDKVTQLGGDRIIDLTFTGAGQPASHLIIEFYAGGNIILTDHEYTILAFLRTVRERLPETKQETGNSRVKTNDRSFWVNSSSDMPSKTENIGKKPRGPKEESVILPSYTIAVRKRYEIASARDDPPITLDLIKAALHAEEVPSAEQSVRRRRRANIAKSYLAAKLGVGPQVVAHGLVCAGYDISVKVSELRDDPQASRKLFDALRPIEELLRGDTIPEYPLKGYLFTVDPGKKTQLKQDVADGAPEHANGTSSKVDEKEAASYSDFAPYLLAQYKDRQRIEYPTFDEAVDIYFAKLEAIAEREKAAKREKAAFGKVAKLSRELKGRVEEFQRAKGSNQRMAEAILANISEVDLAIEIVRSALVSAVDWESLSVMVEQEKENGNPIAETIHGLNLEKNEITLMLEDTWGDLDEEEDSDDYTGSSSEGEGDDQYDSESDETSDASGGESGGKRKKKRSYERSAATRKVLLVPVDVSLSAYANASSYFSKRKTAAVKMTRAIEVTDRTIRAAERKAAAEAQKMETAAAAASIKARRKPHWFEKFLWMVSSENFLVVAGRDAQQNELLVKRYMAPADVYVHADMHGAASVIIKNIRGPGQESYGEIPRMTLEQAGAFAMCRSTAWEAKIVTSAWWVRAGQVSKTAATGEYLTTGSFVIRGKKNFLNPCQLVMGFGFLFKIDESCVGNHRGERFIRGLDLSKSSVAKAHKPIEQVGKQDEEREITTTGAGKERGKDEASEQPRGTVDAGPRAEVGIDSESRSEVVEEDASLFAKFSKASASSLSNIQPSEATATTSDRLVSDSLSDTKQAGGKTKTLAEDTEELQKEKQLPAEIPSDSERGLESGQVKSSPTAATTLKKKGPKQRPLPRGKRSKMKKIRKKYGDQDEDERSIALVMLGTKRVKEMENTFGAEDGARTTETEKESQAQERERRPPKPSRREKREVMQLLKEEGILELTNLERESLTTLDMLTANPVPEDIVQYALPVCAPYNALSTYRYKVKLLPGSMKRGKACREATSLFLKAADKDLSKFKQERDALRAVPEDDAIHAMMGSVRIVAPGLAQVQAANKRKKKQSGKRKK